MADVRVGIIGTGFGARVVAPTYEAAGAAVVEVVTPRDEEAVAALCRRDDLDLISIHSPPFLHVEHVALACAGHHAVLCDKPFGRSAAEAEQMVGLARDAGVLNLLNFEFRYEPGRIRVKELIDAGEIGTPEHVQWTVINAGSRNPLRPYGWLFDRDLGGGWVGAWGAHGVDTVRWLLGGEVVHATAELRTTITHRPDGAGELRACTAEDGFTASLTMDTGATVAFDTSFAVATNQANRTVVFGSEGTIELANDRIITLRRPDGSKEDVELPRQTGDQHAGALGPWLRTAVDAVTRDEQIATSFADGLAVRKVLDALLA